MPLVQCHECEAEISTQAKRCPQCGAPALVYAGTKPVLNKHAIAAGLIMLGINLGWVFAVIHDVVPLWLGAIAVVATLFVYLPLARLFASIW